MRCPFLLSVTLSGGRLGGKQQLIHAGLTFEEFCLHTCTFSTYHTMSFLSVCYIVDMLRCFFDIIYNEAFPKIIFNIMYKKKTFKKNVKHLLVIRCNSFKFYTLWKYTIIILLFNRSNHFFPSAGGRLQSIPACWGESRGHQGQTSSPSPQTHTLSPVRASAPCLCRKHQRGSLKDGRDHVFSVFTGPLCSWTVTAAPTHSYHYHHQTVRQTTQLLCTAISHNLKSSFKSLRSQVKVK